MTTAVFKRPKLSLNFHSEPEPVSIVEHLKKSFNNLNNQMFSQLDKPDIKALMTEISDKCLDNLGTVQNCDNPQTLHLFSFKTPISQSKKNKKKCKINSRNFTYDGLTFSSSLFLLEDVKDEIWKHNGRSCFSIQV